MTTRPTPPRTAPIPALAALVVVVIGIVVVAFRGSWGALRDAALAAHFERSAAELYPFAVDGLLVVAVLAAVLLRHQRGARRYCMWIIGGYTGASWLINYLHGLGMFQPDRATGVRPVPPWPVVAVIASLVIGSIFLGSHLLVYVWRHFFPGDGDQDQPVIVEQTAPPVEHDAPPQDEPLQLPATNVELAEIAYRESLGEGKARLSQKKLVERFGVTRREAEAIQHKVRSEIEGELGRADEDDDADGTDQPTPVINGHKIETGVAS